MADLKKAQEDAAARSAGKPGKPVFITVDGDSLECKLVNKRDSQTVAVFLDGAEVSLETYEIEVDDKKVMRMKNPEELSKNQPKEVETETNTKTEKKKKSNSKKKSTMEKTAKKAAKKVATKSAKKTAAKHIPAGGKHPIKDGATATYDGKKVTVRRSYWYKERPFCILTDGRQVSANSLNKKKEAAK